jgi:hypothetical protein
MNPTDERFRRSPQQDQVFAALIQKDARVADWYESAVYQLATGTSAARFCASANLVRLMLNELPRFFQLPQLISLQPLSTRLAKLEQPWHAACRSRCRCQDGWRGEIDPEVGHFLSEYEAFSRENRAQPSKQDIAGGALRRADPAQVAIPGNLVDQMAGRWIELHRYFTALAHGSTGGTDKFEENLEEVERMLCIMLGPRPSESLAAIDEILAEEDSGA